MIQLQLISDGLPESSVGGVAIQRHWIEIRPLAFLPFIHIEQLLHVDCSWVGVNIWQENSLCPRAGFGEGLSCELSASNTPAATGMIVSVFKNKFGSHIVVPTKERKAKKNTESLNFSIIYLLSSICLSNLSIHLCIYLLSPHSSINLAKVRFKFFVMCIYFVYLKIILLSK